MCGAREVVLRSTPHTCWQRPVTSLLPHPAVSTDICGFLGDFNQAWSEVHVCLIDLVISPFSWFRSGRRMILGAAVAELCSVM
jgi:hypothetical protein